MKVAVIAARSLAILLVAVATSTLAVDDAAKPKTASLQVDGTGPFPFSAEGSKTTIWLPVKLPDSVVATDLTLTQQSVRFERRPSADITRRFSVAPQLIDKDRTAPTLAIEVSQIEQLRPGQYDLVISVNSKSKVAVAPLTVALERRAAQLSPPGKQTIDVNIDWPWSTSTEGTAAPASLRLLLADDGRDSAVRGVTVVDGPFTSADGNVRATLGATAASKSANQYLLLDLHPAGFAVGTSQGRLEIHSTDLKSPSVVEVEVRTRLAKYWIPAVVGVGLLLGFLLRIELQRRLELAKAKQQGLEVLHEFSRQRNGVLDHTFSSAVADEFGKLENAVLGEDSLVIGTVLTASQAVVKLAGEDLKKRLDEAVALLADLRTQVPGTGPLPPTMQAVVDSLGAVAATGVEKLKGRDAKGIKDEITVALVNAAKTLRLETARSASILASSNTSYRDIITLLDPERANERGPQFVAAFESIPDALTAPPSVSTVTEIAALLDAWRNYGAQRVIVIGSLCTYLEDDSTTFDRLVTTLADGGATLGPVRQAWREAIKRVRDGMSRDVAANEAFALPSSTARPVHQAMRELAAGLLKARPDVKRAALADFHASIDAKNYFVAMRQLPPVSAALETLSSRPSASRPEDWCLADDALFLPGSLKHIAAGPLPLPGQLSDPRTLKAYVIRNRRQLAVANAIQTGAVSAILAVASIAFFRDRFIGTPMELAGLFFWGFTADFSASKFSELARSWASKSPSTAT